MCDKSTPTMSVATVYAVRLYSNIATSSYVCMVVLTSLIDGDMSQFEEWLVPLLSLLLSISLKGGN